MYAWIDGERWDADDQPALSERHGWLEGQRPDAEEWECREIYGRILNEDETNAVIKALVAEHAAIMLPGFGNEDV